MLKEKERIFENAFSLAGEIKRKAEEILGECEVYITGSFAEGRHNLSSDLDILIVSERIPERFSFDWYADFVKSLTDNSWINIHPVNRQKFKEVGRYYGKIIEV